MNKKDNLRLHWGVIADPISKQLKDKGYNLPNSKLYYFDRIKEALNVLYFNKLTTDHQYNVINIRCHNYVVREVEKWLKGAEMNKASKERVIYKVSYPYRKISRVLLFRLIKQWLRNEVKNENKL